MLVSLFVSGKSRTQGSEEVFSFTHIQERNSYDVWKDDVQERSKGNVSGIQALEKQWSNKWSLNFPESFSAASEPRSYSPFLNSANLYLCFRDEMSSILIRPVLLLSLWPMMLPYVYLIKHELHIFYCASWDMYLLF